MSIEQVDFIVVGAGSAGCVLANRLSADARNSVALIEAGPPDRNFWIHLPIGYGRTMWDSRINWKFYTEPEPHMDGRRIYWPRGRVLGGSSSINGLIVIRGQPEDYDHWAQLGNRGWSWQNVLPYFIKLEHNDDLAGDQLHGASGPLQVTSIHDRHELIEAFIAAADRCGIPRTADFNGRAQEGAGYFQLTTRNGWRGLGGRRLFASCRKAPQPANSHRYPGRRNLVRRPPRGRRHLPQRRLEPHHNRPARRRACRRRDPVAAIVDAVGYRSWRTAAAPRHCRQA